MRSSPHPRVGIPPSRAAQPGLTLQGMEDRRAQASSHEAGRDERPGNHRSLATAAPGDWIEVDGTRGASPQRGVILEVIGSGAHERLRVHWDEQHESLFYPAEQGFAIHARPERAPKRLTSARKQLGLRPEARCPVGPTRANRS